MLINPCTVAIKTQWEKHAAGKVEGKIILQKKKNLPKTQVRDMQVVTISLPYSLSSFYSYLHRWNPLFYIYLLPIRTF